MGAKFGTASFQRSFEMCGWDGDLRGQRGRMKIQIAQLFVFSERGVTVENLTARADQIANSLGLVADLQRTSREPG